MQLKYDIINSFYYYSHRGQTQTLVTDIIAMYKSVQSIQRFGKFEYYT